MLQLSGLSTWLKVLMMIAVLTVAVAAGWTVWKRVAKGSVVDSYQTCVDAGNPIQTSYPSVCATKDGKRFVNPSERLN